MKNKKERGLHELYESDPEKADAEIWKKDNELFSPSRRGFIKKGGLTTLAVVVGAHIPFFRNMPMGFIPEALAASTENFVIKGTDGLHVFNDRPINGEPPPHLLNDDITPASRHFVRNNGRVPGSARSGNASDWTLTVDGEVHNKKVLTLDQLQRFKHYTYALQIECGGNGRAGYNPPAKGNQWTFGAIGCSTYTGVRMKDVLSAVGLKDSAVYTGYYGRDIHLSGQPDKVVISRGTPIDKAMDDHTLIAWEMNGKPLPALHGFPVRVITPGWPGSTSMKWLRRIWVRNKVHDGPKMMGYAYRVPKYNVPPGTHVPEKDMKIIESMPIKSLITRPKTGIPTSLGKPLTIGGHAWAGDRKVKLLHVSYDFGATWIQAVLKEPVNPYAWQNWEVILKLPQKGYYEVWARATDEAGVMQPMVVPGWNPKGYLNNAMHRIAVTVT
jgi:DMSO/TMAO reductase YedYZ molybdopterin-dependent catalytic subunit